jgi:glutamyl-tRNA synthetase
MREEQTKLKLRTGLYGHWAKERNLTEEQIEANLAENKRFVINFKSNGDYKNRVAVNDLIKGKRMLPENDLDIVILKADGLPTYHFAHVVDDHLMGTKYVNRTDEWFISTPLHLQMFEAMGWQPPFYLQPAPVQKMDGNSKRKLSKRKDPEAGFQFYMQEGYPKDAIIDYLMNLLNSNYEEWRKNNVKTDFKEFPFDYKKISESGALLDFQKLDNVTKNYMATLTAEEVYEMLLAWAENYDKNLLDRMKKEKQKFIAIFEIERKNTDRVRKDYGKLSAIWNEIDYFFDFTPQKIEVDPKILSDYLADYNENWTKEEWFENIKEKALKFGYSSTGGKEQDTTKYKGNISDFVGIFRQILTGRKNSPDLYFIMKIFGKEEMAKRFSLKK